MYVSASCASNNFLNLLIQWILCTMLKQTLSYLINSTYSDKNHQAQLQTDQGNWNTIHMLTKITREKMPTLITINASTAPAHQRCARPRLVPLPYASTSLGSEASETACTSGASPAQSLSRARHSECSTAFR